MRKLSNWLKFWFATIRAPFFVAVITPAILGTLIAWQSEEVFHWHYFLLVTLAAICVNAFTNLINDYYDRPTDEINVEYVAPFTGGSRMIQQGLLTPAQVFRAGILFLAVLIAIGIYLTWATWDNGPMLLIVGAIAVLSGFFYTAPPLKLGYRWFAEAWPGLNCGILVTLAAYWVQAQSLSWLPVIASIPLAIIIAAVLWINEIPDYAADKAIGKNNSVVLLGKEKAARGYLILIVAAYLGIIFGVAFGGVTPLALLGLLSFPIALRAMRIAIMNYAHSPSLAPANAMTPMIYLSTGLLLATGFLIAGVL